MSNVVELPYANPVNGEVYKQLGRENYEMLMEMWSAVTNNEFDQWFEHYSKFEGHITHCISLSQSAVEISKNFKNV